MAHMIDQAHKGEQAAYFGREPAWHRLGTVVPEGADTATALRLARADYDVREAPVYAMTPEGAVESPTHKMTYRAHPDTGLPQQLGIVGNTFHVRQPRETFAWLDQLLDADVTVETAGVLRDGRSIFVTCRLPDGVTLDPGGLDDRVEPYIFLRDAYDGQSSFTGGTTLVRIVCANTEAFALRTAKRTFTIQHRSGFEGQLAQARETLGLAFRYQQELVPVLEGMARAEVQESAWDRALRELLVPDPEPTKGDTPSKAAVTIAERNREQLTTLWKRDPARGTVWGIYNAYTEWLDHERPQRLEDGRDTAVIEETYASDKARAARWLRRAHPVVDRLAEQSAKDRQLATA